MMIEGICGRLKFRKATANDAKVRNSQRGSYLFGEDENTKIAIGIAITHTPPK